MAEKEEWRVYKDTRKKDQHRKGPKGSLWEVSNQGNVKRNGYLYKPKIGNGYLWAGTYAVHRMVAICFIPNPENKPYVDHINGNKTDNRACNLRWATPKENMNNPNTIWKQQGENNGFYNKSHSKETIKLMSDKKNEYFKTHDSGMKNKQHTKETRKLISELNKEYYKTHKHPLKGKHRVYDENGKYHYE